MQKKAMYYLLCVLLSVFLPVQASDVTSEVLNLRAEPNILFIDVAKRYPEIKFSRLENTNEILIELLNTKYHDQFNDMDEIKISLINELDFLDDVSVDLIDTHDDVQNIVIDLTLKENVNLQPKLKSTIDNVVQISFLSPLEKNLAEKAELSEEVQLSPEEQVTSLYNEAVEKQTRGNLEEAEKLYGKVLKLDNSFYLARYNLAKIYLDKRIFNQAIALLESIIKDYKEEETYSNQEFLLLVQNMLGTIYYLSGDFNKALEVFNSLLKEEPNFYQAHYNIALIYEKVEDIRKARKSLAKAVELNPDFADAYFHASMLDLILNKKKDAVVGFEKVVKLVPGTRIAKISQKELDKLEESKKK